MEGSIHSMVDLEKLPLPETIRRRGRFVLAWYDTFLDWDNAPESSRWLLREESAFNSAAQELLRLLREQLGSEFEIADESGTAGSA